MRSEDKEWHLFYPFTQKNDHVTLGARRFLSGADFYELLGNRTVNESEKVTLKNGTILVHTRGEIQEPIDPKKTHYDCYVQVYLKRTVKANNGRKGYEEYLDRVRAL